MELTPEEKRAIAALKRLEKTWPQTLWLFSGSGSLCVMKCNEDGERVYSEGRGSGVDQTYTAATLKIPNDGGDW